MAAAESAGGAGAVTAATLSDAALLERLGFSAYAAAHRDCEVILWVNLQLDEPVLAWIRIPRKLIAEHLARREPPPFWRHGAVVRVTKAAER
ncbi:MAG: hypothetical protein AB1651_19255 [Pseudomonadota bacterium]